MHAIYISSNELKKTGYDLELQGMIPSYICCSEHLLTLLNLKPVSFYMNCENSYPTAF